MKIGLFTDTFYPEINGVATSCLTLERELTKRGHEVHVFAPKCKGWEDNQRENIHYLTSKPFVALKDRNIAIPTPNISQEATSIDFDVVHTNSEFVMGYFGRYVADTLGCAIVHTYHTIWEDYTYYLTHGVADDTVRRITRKYSQWWCNRVDRVITPTEKTLDLLRQYGVDAPIDVIPSGMISPAFRPNVTTIRSAWMPDANAVCRRINGCCSTSGASRGRRTSIRLCACSPSCWRFVRMCISPSLEKARFGRICGAWRRSWAFPIR